MTMSAGPQEGKSSSDQKKAKDKRRRGKDRRKEDSNGYMYVSVVGWICRREKLRRHPRQSE